MSDSEFIGPDDFERAERGLSQRMNDHLLRELAGKIEPALSAEEWKRAGLPPTVFVRPVDGMLTARPDGADDYRDGYLVVDMPSSGSC